MFLNSTNLTPKDQFLLNRSMTDVGIEHLDLAAWREQNRLAFRLLLTRKTC
jgi:hypothetical protein